MSTLDWIVLLVTLAFVVFYGIWKGRGDKNIEGYLLGDHSLNWFKVCLSVMATQASAITFLSVPGQAYSDGMRFVQFYFGLPLAMIVISITFVPVFHRLKLYTAYEFLEGRFDLKTRVLTSLLFLIPRALSTGVTISAPSIILSTILGWDLGITTFFTGIIVIIYCVVGGTKGVSYTQMQQMFVILIGMFMAGYLIVKLLPNEVGFIDSLKIAGKFGKMNVIDWKFDLNNRYNVWSGLIGGFFLQLSYFGTDQSQVGRYLTASSEKESKLGLLANGLLKIPMQFFILLVGVLVFVFYQFNQPPLNFNSIQEQKVISSDKGVEYLTLQKQHAQLFEKKKATLLAIESNKEVQDFSKVKLIEEEAQTVKKKAQDLILIADPNAEKNDVNYIFLTFVNKYLPKGLVGLLIAMILLASMGSMASAFNSLTSTSIIDIYKRLIKPEASETHYLNSSKLVTLFWGIFCVVVALFATKMGSLIEVVNILGSWFYGTILGVFLVAFYMKNIKGGVVFYAAILAEALVLYFYFIDLTAFLWLNLIGCVMVMGFSYLFSLVTSLKKS
ncbi:MAG: sodium:solute symporter [Bacteroidota bacterium]